MFFPKRKLGVPEFPPTIRGNDAGLIQDPSGFVNYLGGGLSMAIATDTQLPVADFHRENSTEIACNENPREGRISLAPIELLRAQTIFGATHAQHLLAA